MDDEQFEGAVDAAWAGFRGRLADRLAELGEDEILRVAVETGVDADKLFGEAPYLRFTGYGEWVLAEVASSYSLDERFEFDEEAARPWLTRGLWKDPDDGVDGHYQWFEPRDADRVAATSVQVLREVYGVAHPAFLDAEGLESDGSSPEVATSELATDDEDEPIAVFASDRDQLQEAVDAAMRVMLPDLQHDPDGDIPVVSGQSVVFVRVLEDRPAVEVFAEIVCEPKDERRLAQEVALLNETHDFARFARKGETVVMSFQLVAFPFAPSQLRAVVAKMTDEVDEIARTLAARIGGRRFLEPVVDPPRRDLHPGMSGLLELLHLGRVSSATVATLFDKDRGQIIRMLVLVRVGQQACGDHDQEVVLEHLRRGLRYVVDGPRSRVRTPLPSKPRSRQDLLTSDDEVGIETLDLGRSA